MRQQQGYALPSLSANADTLTRHYLTQFMHEFQSQRGKDASFRIYKAIEKTAGKTGCPPEAVARALVESGLRAKESFPGKFITALESKRVAPAWNVGAVTAQQKALMDFWGVAPAATGYKPVRRYH